MCQILKVIEGDLTDNSRFFRISYATTFDPLDTKNAIAFSCWLMCKPQVNPFTVMAVGYCLQCLVPQWVTLSFAETKV